MDDDRSDQGLWFKDAIIYELHVRAFHDSDGDGIGDFRGLTQKLDYLRDLGVSAVWLLPFYPSPLRDDGYDIADYTGIHENYGTMRQFRRFVQQAHDRGIRVITELAINHTSDQHPWFRRAVRAPADSRWRDWYVWSDGPEPYQEARVIFQDFESSNWTWHPEAEQYYWHRFYHHQPDLNFDNPEVREAVKEVLDFWMETGVDGMRLDAIPYLFERDGTSCENLPETHEFLKELRRHLDDTYPDRMFLAEANQWPEDAAAYFGDGDECQMNFHFPLMPRLFMALRMEDRFPVIDILQQTPEIPHNCQWGIFLRNHDELTLEMVTDEERDYMVRSYAHDPQMRINLGIRRRLAPLLDNNRRKIELLNGLLFSLPGTPILYYGDEIGMGDNIYLGDRNGVRTPMQWSPDRNAGFSQANPQRLFLPVVIDPEYHFETVNVEAQQNNPSSLLWWMRRLIRLRQRNKVFGRGSIEFLTPDNAKIIAFVRELDDERVLVVANLSRYAQACELDLEEYRGMSPVELFGRTTFPSITDRPYALTLGPHDFYWFALERMDAAVTLSPSMRVVRTAPEELPSVTVSGAWTALLRGRGRDRLEAVLPEILRGRRWFGGKARQIRRVTLSDDVTLVARSEEGEAHLLVVDVEYVDGEPESYAMPVAFAVEDEAERLLEERREAVLATVEGRGRGESGVLYDAAWSRAFELRLLSLVGGSRRVGGGGEVRGRRSAAYKHLRGDASEELEPRVLGAEQSNTSLVYGDRFILKLIRRLEPGTNPDLELSRHLTEQTDFEHVPPLAGWIDYRPARQGVRTLAILQGFVPNEGDAWAHTLDELGRYCERMLTDPPGTRPGLASIPSLLELTADEIPELVHSIVGPHLESATLLGQRTAELHHALAADSDDPDIGPERYTGLYRRSLYQSMRGLARRTLQLARRSARRIDAFEDQLRTLADREPEILERYERLTRDGIDVARIRIHGDYHLGQVLHTGRDFVIIDLEGEPARPLSERRLKRSALRDVAGMVRSFHYAAYAALFGQREAGGVDAGSDADLALEEWLRYWYVWVAAAFLRSYRGAAAGAVFMPDDPGHLKTLLDAFLLDKALYELTYELNNRPTWVGIPLQGVFELLRADD